MVSPAGNEEDHRRLVGVDGSYNAFHLFSLVGPAPEFHLDLFRLGELSHRTVEGGRPLQGPPISRHRGHGQDAVIVPLPEEAPRRQSLEKESTVPFRNEDLSLDIG